MHINRMHAHTRTHSLFGYTVSSKKWTFVGKRSASSCGREFCPPRSDEYAGLRTSQEELIPSDGHTRTVSQTPTAWWLAALFQV